MKLYERKIKIEIISVIVMLSYYFMVRDDNTLLERGVLVALLGAWALFALGYHIWDIKRRGLTLKQWIKSLEDRVKSNDGIPTRIFKFIKIVYISFLIIILSILILVSILVIIESRDRILEATIMLLESAAFSIIALEIMLFFIAAIIRFYEKHRI